MSVPEHPYCHAEAFIEHDQVDWMGDGVLCQLVTVMHGRRHRWRCSRRRVRSLPSRRAGLAFELLAVAEYAERLTRHRQEDAAMSARQNAQTAALEALIEAHATELKLPTVKARFRQMAAEATREQQTPVAYLAALLEAEMHERAERRERRRLLDARFPLLKRLEEFRFADNPSVPQATIAALADVLVDQRPRFGRAGRRLGYRQDASGDRARGLRMPARSTRPIHDARRPRQRAPRGRQPPRARPSRRPLLPHRGSGPR